MPPKGFPRHVDPVATRRAEPSESSEEEEEEVDLTEVMNEMTLGERRRVYALKGLFNDYKALRRQLREEIAEIQIAHSAATQRLHDTRRDIVQGVREVTAEELAAIAGRMAAAAAEGSSAGDDANEGGKKAVKIMTPGDELSQGGLAAAAASPAGGIPDFWMTSLLNNVVFTDMITERDRAALQHLRDIRSEFVEGHPHKGVQLTFSFAPNEFFTDSSLTKTYHMEFDEDNGDVEITKIEGAEIHWTSPKQNLTVTLKEKKMRNKRTKQICVVEREEKCDSFFNFFSPPVEPKEDDEDDSDEDEDFYEQEMEMDIEAGQALMEDVVPKAAYYYTGKAMEEVAKELMKQFGDFGAGDDDEEDEDEEEDEEEESGAGAVDFKGMLNRRGGGAAPGRGGGAGRGAGGAPQQQECKQQ